MARFGYGKDIQLFKHFNQELIHDIISSEIEIYKLIPDETDSNLYGEASHKTYYKPLRIYCLIRQDPQQSDYQEAGVDYKQITRFAFLRDDLVEKNVLIEQGDILHWRNLFWEIDHIENSQLFMSRDPQTNIDLSDKWGFDISIIANCHVTRRNRPNIEETRFGT